MSRSRRFQSAERCLVTIIFLDLSRDFCDIASPRECCFCVQQKRGRSRCFSGSQLIHNFFIQALTSVDL